VEHPSALSKFEEVMEMSKGKKIVMFLDYDGTLSPIVEDPDRAFMSEAVRIHTIIFVLNLHCARFSCLFT
jgi:trehalose 6-phosphate phosphatase